MQNRGRYRCELRAAVVAQCAKRLLHVIASRCQGGRRHGACPPPAIDVRVTEVPLAAKESKRWMTKALTRSILQSHPRNSAVKWGAVELVERDIHVVQDSGDGSISAGMHETRGRCSGLRGKRLLQEAVRLKETLSINCELSEKSLLILAKRIRQAAPVMPRRQSGQSTLRPRRNQKMLRGLGCRAHPIRAAGHAKIV